jgi:hypothetical protein
MGIKGNGKCLKYKPINALLWAPNGDLWTGEEISEW